MIELSIDNNNIQVPEGSTVMEAAEQAGTFFPPFFFSRIEKIATAQIWQYRLTKK